MQLIIRMGYRLSDLVNDILDLEKMKQGMPQIRPVPVDVHAVICSEMNFYRLLSKHKNLPFLIMCRTASLWCLQMKTDSGKS
ncbi:hypothetical protein KQR56_18060 [Bacillus velezensis]|nr:hypothetical protein [Bacillus velezensis]